MQQIDWEWVGGDDKQAQSNYFYKGDTTTYDRGAFHPVAGAVTTAHKYSIEYTPKAVKWFIDDAVVRTLTYEEANGGKNFPQTPMEVRLGSWVAGDPDKPEGTIEWAGGLTDFKKAPFNAYYKSISIVDYAGGEGPTDKDVKEYIYGDNSGTYQSIKVVLADGSSDDKDDEPTSSAKPTTSAKPTKSAEETKSAKPTESKDEETKSAEPTKSVESKTTKAAPSTTLATSSAVTPAPSSSPATTGGVSSTPVGSSAGSSPTDEAPPNSGAGALKLGSAAIVGAGLFMAQLFI